MGIAIDTDEMTRQSARIAAAAAQARSISTHTHQMLGTAGSLADGTTSAAVIGFVSALARGLDGDVRGLDRLADALLIFARTGDDVERTVAAGLDSW